MQVECRGRSTVARSKLFVPSDDRRNRCPLELLDLPEPAHIPLAAVEAGAKERANELCGELSANDLRAEAEHVHVIVFDTLMSGVDVVADRRTDSVDLAGRDCGADNRAADKYE